MDVWEGGTRASEGSSCLSLSHDAHAVPSPHSPQLCTLALSDEGLTLRWEDDSKALHCSLFVAAGAFTAFDLPPSAPRAVPLPLAPLADSLAVFAALPPADVTIRIPSSSGAGLELEAVGGGGRTCARVDGAAPHRAPPPPPPPRRPGSLLAGPLRPTA